LKVETRKELLLYLIEPIKKCELITSKAGGYQGREQAFRKRQVYGDLFNLLMRGNLNFTTKEIIEMLKAFKISDEANSKKFVDWPIGFSVQQIERIVKRNGVGKELKMFLEDFLKWDQLKQTKYYWGTDLEKVRVKVEKILFENENEDGEVAPYVLPDDRLAKVVNSQVENLENDLKNDFYNLFHLFIKATGSKPSKKYLSETSSFIDSIGITKYKSIVLEWIELAISLKAIETRKQYTYSNGQVYDYSTFEFLHEKNHVFLKGLVWSLSKFHDSNTLQLLARLTERCFEKIPGVGPTAASVGNACIFTLGSTRGLEGISHLSRLKLK